MQYISKDNLFKLLDGLKADYDVFVPAKKDEQRFYRRYEQFSDDITIGEVRPFEPAKVFFSRAREVVAEDFKNELPGAAKKPFAIVGVKACDLTGIRWSTVETSVKEDPVFAACYEEVRREIAVKAEDSLMREAMSGKISAQMKYLEANDDRYKKKVAHEHSGNVVLTPNVETEGATLYKTLDERPKLPAAEEPS